MDEGGDRQLVEQRRRIGPLGVAGAGEGRGQKSGFCQWRRSGFGLGSLVRRIAARGHAACSDTPAISATGSSGRLGTEVAAGAAGAGIVLGLRRSPISRKALRSTLDRPFSAAWLVRCSDRRMILSLASMSGCGGAGGDCGSSAGRLEFSGAEGSGRSPIADPDGSLPRSLAGRCAASAGAATPKPRNPSKLRSRRYTGRAARSTGMSNGLPASGHITVRPDQVSRRCIRPAISAGGPNPGSAMSSRARPTIASARSPTSAANSGEIALSRPSASVRQVKRSGGPELGR